MNKIVIFGNLGGDARLGEPAQNGNTPISFSVAVSEKRGDKEHTEWFTCTKWVSQGGSTKIVDYLKRGTKVVVAGKVSARAYTDRDGNARASIEVNVQEITLAGQAQGNGQQTAPPAQQRTAPPAGTNYQPQTPVDNASDDLPF